MKPRFVLFGLIVGLIYVWWRGEATGRSRPDTSPTSTVPKSPAHASVLKTAKDSLSEIEGIGPAYERALNDLGITTFEQLARQSPDSLAARMSARVTAERIQREKWIEQARARTLK